MCEILVHKKFEFLFYSIFNDIKYSKFANSCTYVCKSKLQWTHTHGGLLNEIESASPISLKFYQIFSDEKYSKCKEFCIVNLNITISLVHPFLIKGIPKVQEYNQGPYLFTCKNTKKYVYIHMTLLCWCICLDMINLCISLVRLFLEISLKLYLFMKSCNINDWFVFVNISTLIQLW